MSTYFRIVNIVWAPNPDSTPDDCNAEKGRLWPFIDIEDCEKFFPTAESDDMFEIIKQFYQAKHHHVIACAQKIYVEKDGIATSYYEDYRDPVAYAGKPLFKHYHERYD